MYNKYIIFHTLQLYYNILQHTVVSWPANGQHKSRTKKCLEFENNAVSHTTFSAQLTCWPGP